MVHVEFIKAKRVEAGYLTLWWKGDYTYELEVKDSDKVVYKKILIDTDQEAAEDEFAKIN